MKRLTRSVILSLIPVGLVFALGVWAKANSNVDHFLGSFLGRAFTTILVSGFLIPALRPYVVALAEWTWRDHNMQKLYAHLDQRVSNDLTIETPEHRKYFRRLFANRPIDATRCASMSSAEAGLFAIGLQLFHRDVTLAREVDLPAARAIFDKAASDERYRRILLTLSLSATLFKGADCGKMADAVMSMAASVLKVDFRSEDADVRFFTRLERASDEEVYIFSTTSQISNLSWEMLSLHQQRISELNLFIVSPQVATDGALRELQKEYTVPSFLQPQGQFLPDPHVDTIRRVIRILQALDTTAEFSKRTGMTIRFQLFRQKYPDIKIRIIRSRAYMQLFVGCLNYANNLYRFGLEITDADMIDRFVKAIETMMADPTKTASVPLDALHVEYLKACAIREAYWYGVQNGVNFARLQDELRAWLGLILKNPSTEWYVNALTSLDACVHATIDRYNFHQRPQLDRSDRTTITALPTPNLGRIAVLEGKHGNARHVSVGMFFFDAEGRLLLVKKRHEPYADKYSIVAGHVEIGETPRLAMKRELQEEIGVVTDEFILLRHYPSIIAETCRYGATEHEWFLFVHGAATAPQGITLSDEILEYRWVRLHEIDQSYHLTSAVEMIFTELGIK